MRSVRGGRTVSAQKSGGRIRAAIISDYLSSHSVHKLHLGAGRVVLPGWLNTDIQPVAGVSIYLDVRRRFPFDNGTFQYVFAEHLIEHLTYPGALSMLRECGRVLVRGGTIRIATPNLLALVGLLGGKLSNAQRRYIRRISQMFMPEVERAGACHVINNAFRNWGHRFIYDAETLGKLLERSGLGGVVERRVGAATDVHLAGLERHGRLIGDERVNRYETMVLEARKT